jgi:GNAT superfamily N-acetyltransferase
MGEPGNLAKIAIDCLSPFGKADRFTLVAEWRRQGRDAIIGEGSYAFDRDKRCGKFAISVADRWQRQGLGSALLCALQFRAVSLGHLDLFGEALKANLGMKSLARRAGFEFSRSPDWRAIRFDKGVGRSDRSAVAWPGAFGWPRARRTVTRSAFGHSVTVSPDPPNSLGKSFSLGRPSRIGSTVSA